MGKEKRQFDRLKNFTSDAFQKYLHIQKTMEQQQAAHKTS